MRKGIFVFSVQDRMGCPVLDGNGQKTWAWSHFHISLGSRCTSTRTLEWFDCIEKAFQIHVELMIDLTSHMMPGPVVTALTHHIYITGF